MKTVKIIGALMAAVLAAAPVTGFAGNVLSFNDNAIVADAANYTPYNNARSIVSAGSTFYITGQKAIMQNGYWYLVADSRGEIFIHNIKTNVKKNLKIRHNTGKIEDFHCPYDKYSVYPGTNTKIMYSTNSGSVYMHYTLNFQGDGNFVSYMGQSSRALWHTDTWRFNASNVRFQYELTENGIFQIRRIFTSGINKGKSDIIWKSDSNQVVRAV